MNAAGLADIAGFEFCSNSILPSCHPTSLSTAHYVVTSDILHVDHKGTKPHHNATSSSSRNTPMSPFQLLGFLVQSARGTRTASQFHRRQARDNDEAACVTNCTISYTSGGPTPTGSGYIPTILGCNSRITTQDEVGAHATAHPATHGDKDGHGDGGPNDTHATQSPR